MTEFAAADRAPAQLSRRQFRQAEEKLGAFPDHRVDTDFTTVLLDDRFADVETQAGAADLLATQRVHARKLLKYSILELLRNPLPLIACRYEHGSALP